ncbi:hypothetical protein F4805DRAFT_414393 [Annulohypoxylon moriforme]|nr:hypothetical protein F4805DRAFT_414393 [Annulohypoxylon moriforme]
MDPLSIASGAAGFISLGLTVTGALIDYCKKYQSQAVDLTQLANHAEQLELFLSLINNRTSRSQNPSGDIGNSLQGCQNACSACLQEFKRLNANYVHLGRGNNFKDRGQNFIRKFKYPFGKTEFDDLRSRFQVFYIQLLGHLQLVHLDVTQEIRSITISESAKVSLVVESVGRRLESSISSAEHATIGIIRNGLEHVEMSFRKSLQGTQNDVKASVASRLHDLSEQLGERQLGQTSDIISYMDQRFRALEDSFQSSLRNTNRIIDHKKFSESTASHFDQDWNFNGMTSSNIPTSTLLSFPCQCPMIGRRGSSMYHEKGCKYSFRNLKKRKLTATFRIFQRKITAIWDFEYSQLAWARDWRINRNLTVRAIVPRNSPSFTAMLRMWTGLGKDFTTHDLEISFRKCLIELQKLFEDGLSWPTDVTDRGLNLLNCFALLCSVLRVEITEEIAMTIVQFSIALLRMGVPSNNVASSYCTIGSFIAGGYLQHCPYSLDGYMLIARNLMDRDFTLEKISGASAIVAIVSSPIPELYEPLACTGFLGYILCRSLDAIARLLHESNLVLYEQTKLGQTPLHLAANWFIGLKSMIELGGQAIRSIINCRDHFDHSALYYAVCLKDGDSILTLLDAGASIDPEIFLPMSLLRQGENIESIIAQILARQRAELSQFALLNLPSETIQDLNLKEGDILDSKAFDVIQTLKSRGVTLPACYDYDPPEGSIYFWDDMTFSVAQKLFEAGFREPNTKYCGCTPLMMANSKDIIQLLMVIEWFEGQGMDLYDPVPMNDCDFELETNKLQPAHRTIHVLIKRLGELVCSHSHWRHSLDPRMIISGIEMPLKQVQQMTRLLEGNAKDPCLCYCTPNGCTPASIYARCSYGYEWKLDEMLNLLKCTELATEGCDGYRVTLDLIRVLTFEILGMKHTCCHILGGYYTLSAMEYGMVICKDSEEVEEIREEDRYLAGLLETLMEEFSMKFQEMNVPLSQFVEEYFWPRMKEVKAEKDELSAEEIGEMRNIGVVLDES